MPHKKRKGERPDGLIQVSLQVGYREDGKPDRRYFYGHSRTEAERKRDEYREQLLCGSSFSADITVGEWVEVFKSTYRTAVNESYIPQDDVPYNRLCASIGSMRMKDVCESDLQSALNAISGMSYSSVTKYAQCIRRVFARAQKNKIIEDNPASELVLPPSVKGTHRALERWEVELILREWNNEFVNGAGLWVLLMLFTGLRRGEMMALDWSAVDLEARTITVRQVAVIRNNQAHIEQRAKTEAGLRTLPICRMLFDALSSVPQGKRTGFVCLSSRGKSLSETAVRRGLQQFCAVLTRINNGESAANPVRLGAEKACLRSILHALPEYEVFSFRAHDLRHTFATALYDAGVPVKAAQYFLGHSDIRMTLDLYTHLSREKDSQSREQIVSTFDAWMDEYVRSAASLPSADEWTKKTVRVKPPEKPYF